MPNNRGSSGHALLDFFGDRLDPDRIVPLLPVRPWKVWKKGDQVGRPSARGEIPVARTGYCCFSSRGLEVSEDLDRHVALLLSFLDLRADEIRRVVREDQLSWEIVCFFTSQWQKDHWIVSEANRIHAESLGISVVAETATKNVQVEISMDHLESH